MPVNTKYKTYCKCYTDGSKNDSSISTTTYIEDTNFSI